ncbi:MAG: MFS transporter [Proteobacteria bacterium]|nr:MFS transporter [Pseudomonadota bacterium]
MKSKPKLFFIAFLLMISFASVNAVLFTPALPNIAIFFNISPEVAQYTISWFLIGYALGQLLYGPVSSRYGRKPALYFGILLQILSSLSCILAGILSSFELLVISRFFVALGSGVGLKMTFTLVNEFYEPKAASQKIAYLTLAFAVTPGLGVALGGLLNAQYGWESCFIAGAVYGIILLLLISQLPISSNQKDPQALQWSTLKKAYLIQFTNTKLIAGGLLMGGCTSIIYLFAALAPFIAIDILQLNSEQYGTANIIPAIGLIMGSLSCAQLVKYFELAKLTKLGLGISTLGSVILLIAMTQAISPIFSLFLPMVMIYYGLSLILPNASSVAMSSVHDKAHGSAVLNFINLGMATVMVLSMECFTTKALSLPIVFLVLCFIMIPVYCGLMKNNKAN